MNYILSTLLIQIEFFPNIKMFDTLKMLQFSIFFFVLGVRENITYETMYLCNTYMRLYFYKNVCVCLVLSKENLKLLYNDVQQKHDINKTTKLCLFCWRWIGKIFDIFLHYLGRNIIEVYLTLIEDISLEWATSHVC